MSMTDPPLPGDEKEAIEAEHMLAAERDAREYMEEYAFGVMNKKAFRKYQYRAILINSDGDLLTYGRWQDKRILAIMDAEELFDNMHKEKAKEIYEKHYK